MRVNEIFLIHHITNTGDKAFGFQLVIGPARIEVGEFNDTLKNFASILQGGLTAFIQPFKRRSGDFKFVDVNRVCPQPLAEVSDHSVRDTRTTKKQ